MPGDEKPMDELKMTTTEQQLFEIAKREIYTLSVSDRKDFKPKNSDELDFFECSVWGLKAALIAAYNLGRSEV